MKVKMPKVIGISLSEDIDIEKLGADLLWYEAFSFESLSLFFLKKNVQYKDQPHLNSGSLVPSHCLP